MANYFVINNKFKPYSFDELIKPYQMYAEQYDKQEEAYEKLAQDAGALEGFINENTDSKSWETYSNYKEALQNAANELATKGLSAGLKRNLTNLKTNYANQIVPIATAVNRRQKAIENFDSSAAAKAGTYIGRRPQETSVDEWLSGATPNTYGVNGLDVANYVKDEVAAASERNYQLYKSHGYNITKIGASQAETAQLINALRTNSRFNENTAQGRYLNSILDDLKNNVIDNAKTAFGYDKFIDGYDENTGEEIPTESSTKFMDAVYHGIMTGMKGQEKQEIDPYAKANYEHNLREQETILTQMLKSGQWTLDPNGRIIKNSQNEGLQNEVLDQYRGLPFLFTGENAKLREELQGKIADFANPIIVEAVNGEILKIANPIEATKAMDSVSDRKASIANGLSDYGITESILSRLLNARAPIAHIATTVTADGLTDLLIQKDSYTGDIKVKTRNHRIGGESVFKPYTYNQELTDIFNAAYREYAWVDGRERELENAGVKKVALSRKDKRKLLENLGLSDDISLDSDTFYNAINNIPNSDISQRAFIHLTVPGPDGEGNRKAINGEVSSAIHSLSGNDINKKNARGTTSVHKVNMNSGEPESKPISKWDEAFTFDEETGIITNILNYDLYPPAIARGNVIVTTTKGVFEIPSEFLGTTANATIKQGNYSSNGRMLPSFQESIGSIMESDYDTAEQSLYSLASVLAKGFGYNFFQRQGATAKE